MHLPVSSNAVTAVYVVIFDLLLQIILAWLVHIFLSSWNLKSLYDDRQPFCLSSTRFAVLTHQGLSRKRIGRVVAVFSTTIVALAIAGSFSINGVSRRHTTTKKVAVLVEQAPQNEVVDFTSHISEDGQRVSETFAAINEAANCYDTNNDVFVRYSAISSLQSVSSTEWRPPSQFANSTCITAENGYFAPNVMVMPFLLVPWNPSTCKVQLKPSRDERISRADVEMSGDCIFQVSDAWCSNYRLQACAALVKFKSCYAAFIETEEQSNVKQTILKTCHSNKLPHTALRSLAYILDTRAVPFSWWAGVMVLLKVRINASVQEYVGETNETDIDNSFLAATLGSALVLMVCLALATLYTWRTHVVQPGRQNYNPFHSTLDMLAFTVSELQGDSSRKLRRKGGIFLYLNNDYLQIKPDLEPSEDGL